MKKDSGAKLREEDIEIVRDDLRVFAANSVIQKEQGGVGPMESSSTQEDVLDDLGSAPCGGAGSWLIINKPRQAMTSTVTLAWLLRDTAYSPGANGLLMCNKDETNGELWARLRMMHEYLPDSIRVPCKRSGSKELQFAHGGRLKCVTAKGSDPALGFSIDRLQASEFGFWAHAREVWGKLAPALVKRKHARVVIESTPGAQGSLYQDMWLNSLTGKGMFRPLFICWWKHAAYTIHAPDFVPSQEELAMMNALSDGHSTISHGHLAFRRKMLDSVYQGDTRLFEHCYPSTPYDGWYSATTPALPSGPLQALVAESLPDPPIGKAWESPEPGARYMIAVDPAGYGTTGDPSAFSIWHLRSRREVAAWSARMDPVALASLLARLGRAFNNALIVVESNSAACITALVGTGYPNVWHDGNASHPGYYRTAVNKERAQVQLVQQLRDGQIGIRSREGLHQLMAWDGTGKRVSDGGQSHHWDRVVVYQMTADIFSILSVPAIAKPFRTEGGQVNLSLLNSALRTRTKPPISPRL